MGFIFRIFINWDAHYPKRPAITEAYPNSPEATKPLMAKGPMYAANIVVIHQGLKRWDEKVDPPITDRVKLPVINALYGAITVDKEIDLEEA